jgi:hypothetical protein
MEDDSNFNLPLQVTDIDMEETKTLWPCKLCGATVMEKYLKLHFDWHNPLLANSSRRRNY